MCGIAGIIGEGSSLSIAEAMVNSLAHRGPDGSGLFQDGQMVIGQTRLSVIDLATGQQPMCNEDESVWIVQNGEIYNYRELRSELEQKGHRFHTNSDTETIIHGYEEYSLDILHRLDGIFAFALWDVKERRLILARDNFGVKPLFYHFDGRTFRFGSEIKALLQDPAVARSVNYEAMHYFLNLRYVPGVQTLFKDIYSVPPAHYLILDDNKIKLERYLDFNVEADTLVKDESYYIEGIRHYLRQAIRKQIVSDVPLGVFLSGGMDSSALVAFMNELKCGEPETFCLGFNEPTDELDDARVVAKYFGTRHHETTMAMNVLSEFPSVIWHVEEPKENVLQGFLLSKFARDHVKVALSGLGGDEIFAGYNIHRFIYPSQSLQTRIPSFIQDSLFRPLSQAAYFVQNSTKNLSLDQYWRGIQMLLATGDMTRYYLTLRNVWDYEPAAFNSLYGPIMQQQQLKLVHTQFDQYFDCGSNNSPLAQVLWAEFNTKMVNDLLRNEDRVSMAHGLETRVPFLDRSLVQFAMSIPIELRIKGNRDKYIFRKAMEGILPSHTIMKKKWGFTINPAIQFKKDLKVVAERVLTRKRVEDRGWFNYDYLRSVLDHTPNAGMRRHYFFLWHALGLEIWAQMFLDGSKVCSQPNLSLESYYEE